MPYIYIYLSRCRDGYDGIRKYMSQIWTDVNMVLHCHIVLQALRNGHLRKVECKEQFNWIRFEGSQKDQKLSQSIE